MAEIKFNHKQLNNPTPQKVSRKFKIIIAIASAMTTWLGTANFIPANVSTVIQSVIGLVVLVCLALEPFFGVETNQKKVPIEDVGSMEA